MTHPPLSGVLRCRPDTALAVQVASVLRAAPQSAFSARAPTSADQLTQHCAPDCVRQMLRGELESELPLLQTWPMSVLHTERVAVWLPEQLQNECVSGCGWRVSRDDVRDGAVAALAGLQGGFRAAVDAVDGEDASSAEVVRLDDVCGLVDSRCSGRDSNEATEDDRGDLELHSGGFS